MLSRYSLIRKKEDLQPFLDKNDFIISLCDNLSFLMLKSISPNDNSYVGVCREKAPILGLYVKMYKFWKECVSVYLKGHLDIYILYTRILYEAYMKMMYLMIKADDSLRRFVVASYKTRYELYTKTDSNSNTFDIVRNNKLLEAMKADGVSFEDITGIKGKTIHKDNFERICQEVENKLFTKDELRMIYIAVYGMSSDVIHSDWGELRQFHLNECENGLLCPNINERTFKHYRAIFPMASILAKSIQAFVTYINESKEIIPNGDGLCAMAAEIERIIILGIENVSEEYDKSPDIFMFE